MRAKGHVKPTPISAEERMSNIWITIHESQESVNPYIEKYNEEPMI